MARVKVGWVGLGKLGLPCALALAQHHQVNGYDVSELPWRILDGLEPLPQEQGFAALLNAGIPTNILRGGSIADVVKWSEIVFVAVQTPHAPEYGGELPAPEQRSDFEYAFLVQACREVCHAAHRQQKPITLVVVSTVLPGTISRLIRPLLNAYTELVYSPQFIAMGTTIPDFTDPEFVICGVDVGNGGAIAQMRSVFLPLHKEDLLLQTDIESAEAIKVFYNVYVSMKIVFANTVMETCHKTGADSDRVTDALAKATQRVVSPRYMRGGMGDGGACHPRDLIAMSWLAERLDLSYDLLGEMAKARERQTLWLAELVHSYAAVTGLPVAILGRAYKPESDLSYGSPAILLAHYLASRHPKQYDPYTGGGSSGMDTFREPHVYAVATRHAVFAEREFPPRSVVIDPFGYVPDQEGVTVIRVGRK